MTIYGDTRKVLYKAHRRRQYAVVPRDSATPYRTLRGLLYIHLERSAVCI